MLKTFKEFCEFMEDLGKPKEARGQITEYLRTLTSSNQVVACNFMMGIPLEKKTTGFNKKMVLNTINEYYVVPDKKYPTLGDMFEGGLDSKIIMQPSLQSVHSLYENLAVHGKDKKDRLQGCLVIMSNVEKKYFVNILLDKLRVRIGMNVISWSLAEIYDIDNKYINNLYKKYESITDVIEILNGRPDEMKIGVPVKPMLCKDIAKDINRIYFPILGQPKLDGLRGQIHVYKTGEIRIFSRSLSDKTDSFPDVIKSLKDNNIPSGIYDSEIYGINSDNSLMSFHQFQHRINNVKSVDIDEYPVSLKIFDVLHYDGKDVIMFTQIERRKLIEHFNLVLDEIVINCKEDIIKYHKKCVNLGFEGIVLKEMDGLYLPGQGKVSFKNWFKYKIAHIRIDCLITGAEWGNGDKMNMLSSFNISVLDDTINSGENDSECSQISFKSIGKIGGGFTHAELKSITERMMKDINKIEDYSYIEDPIILEIKAEKVMKNECGIGLRFPQLVFYREDKNITDLDTISMVLQYI